MRRHRESGYGCLRPNTGGWKSTEHCGNQSLRKTTLGSKKRRWTSKSKWGLLKGLILTCQSSRTMSTIKKYILCSLLLIRLGKWAFWMDSKRIVTPKQAQRATCGTCQGAVRAPRHYLHSWSLVRNQLRQAFESGEHWRAVHWTRSWYSAAAARPEGGSCSCSNNELEYFWLYIHEIVNRYTFELEISVGLGRHTVWFSANVHSIDSRAPCRRSNGSFESLYINNNLYIDIFYVFLSKKRRKCGWNRQDRFMYIPMSSFSDTTLMTT